MKQFSNIEILEKICQVKYKKIQEKGVFLGYTKPSNRNVPIIKPKILEEKDSELIIAEIKRASPTEGNISEIFNPLSLAQIYLESGADVISVLCEEDYFKGSLLDLQKIKQKFPNTCILRKDFILMKEEIEVSYIFGADMVLLIVAIFMQNSDTFKEIYNEILAWNLTPLIEVHTLEEYKFISCVNLKNAIVGINSRNLKTFEINMMETMKLRAYIPSDIPVIFESGIQSSFDAFIAGNAGFQGILCGTFLVRTLDLKSLESQTNEGCDIHFPLSHNSQGDVSCFTSIHLPQPEEIKNNKQEKQKNTNITMNILTNIKEAFLQGKASKKVFYTLTKRFAYKNQNTILGNNTIRPLVKVCGINDLSFLYEAMKYADLLGFIVVAQSPRYVDEEFLQKATQIMQEHFCSKNCIDIANRNLDGESLENNSTPIRVGVVTKESLEIGLTYLNKGYFDCLQLHDTPIQFMLETKKKTQQNDSKTPIKSHIIHTSTNKNYKNNVISIFYGDLNLTHFNAMELGYIHDFFPFFPSLRYDFGLSITSNLAQNIADSNQKYFHTDSSNTFRAHFVLWDNSCGHANTINYNALQAFLDSYPLFHGNLWLAGGIDCTNLKKVLMQKPMLIDICSGFEVERGKKDIQKLKDFFRILEQYNIINQEL
ncbi:phosphoribosylanthranilate isomerase [Helicobacter didelphidarum]|uniref:N-(5'-phosphoribosyl)anthranilate isomerase n=1 Tax=Helicobacter didelphidarum TaxID=2040648 RepID=A0A3D8IJ81_9HELI|nr:bifunctional indole-3-glycerol phosphate synthase/phosphoribosylanthranilate isomerase [Helicobacter didelphidarum]RDU64995.1 phosphoribosylanthranilate isomerase [Helicobacter didelphidarum]